MEEKILKYPRERVISVTCGRDDAVSDYQPIIDFANEYKCGPKSKVVVMRHDNSSLLNIRFGSRIRVLDIIFYSYEPVGILREKCIQVISEAGMSGTFNIDGFWYETR